MICHSAKLAIGILSPALASLAFAQTSPSSFDSCSIAPEGLSTLVVMSKDRKDQFAVVEQPNHRENICIKVAACSWSVAGVRRGAAAPFTQAEEPKCAVTFPRQDSKAYHREECIVDTHTSPFLVWTRAVAQLAAGSALCDVNAGMREGPTYSLEDGERQDIILQLQGPAGMFCLALTLRLSDATHVSYFQSTCSNAVSDASATKLAHHLQQVPLGGNWLGSISEGGAYELKLNLTDSGEMRGSGAVHTSGWADEGDRYVQDWLSKIVVASNSSQKLNSKNDPLVMANSSTFIGRSSRWLLAGLFRTSQHAIEVGRDTPLSTAEQLWEDWLIRQELSGGNFRGTLIRGEFARSDWSKTP